MTIGQLLIRRALPPEMRDQHRVLDNNGVKALFQDLAEKHPDQYRDVSHKLLQIGRRVSTESNGMSVGISDLASSKHTLELRERLQNQLQDIYAQDIPEAEKNKQVITLAIAAQKELSGKVFDEAHGNKNPLAIMAKTGVRGNAAQVNSLLGADMLYVDNGGKEIPIPVTHNYSEGLTPTEYFAGAFGARKGTIDVKMCLHGATRVLMADWSTKAIKDIVPGEYVMGSDTAGRFRPVCVTNKFENGDKLCNTYTFRVGNAKTRFVQLTATGDHKILAQIKAGHTGQNISRSVYEPTPLPLYLARPHKTAAKCPFVAWPSAGVTPGLPGAHEPRALLLGLLLGDGHTPKNGEYQLSCADPQLLADTRDYVRDCGFEFIKPKQGYSHYMRSIVEHKQLRSATGGFGATTNPFKLWIRDIGLHGKLAYDKRLPADIWFWDDTSVLQLVAGLFATDGCVYLRKNGCSVYFDSTSFEMLDELKRVLEVRFGIWCTATQRILKDKMQWAKRDRYRFSLGTVAAVRRFAELISLPGKKQAQLQKGVTKLSSYPNSQEIGFKLQTVVAAGWHATYDIEVDHPDHLFVLENGLVVSNSTAKSGFTSKQLNAITHRLLVTAKDQEDEYDPATLRGLPVDTSDPSNVGALLAHDVGGYKRNQTLSPRILKDLKAQGLDNILVRSPTVGGPKDGGVYAYDTGVRERGGLAPTGDWVGLAGAQALGETITQSMLSSKHSGGVAGSAAGGAIGYPAFSNLLQAPAVFNGAAAHAQRDGRVQAITEAPQGGTFVTVDGQEHYVPVGRKVTVKQNDEIEAGDMLSDGIPHPSEIVKHKGIGEGRRYFTNAMRQVAIDSGTKAHRRNIELISRGLINHVRLTDEYEDGVPGETMPYQTLESTWVPRDGHTMGSPASMKNQYLERPNLHYSIGTRITPSVIKMMNQYGVKQVYAHRDPPPFEPTMVRAMASTATDPDYMTNMLGSYQKASLLDAVHRGRSTDTQGSSYVPALAAGTTFGVSGLTKGWDPKAGIELGPNFEKEPIKPAKPLAPSALD